MHTTSIMDCHYIFPDSVKTYMHCKMIRTCHSKVVLPKYKRTKEKLMASKLFCDWLIEKPSVLKYKFWKLSLITL